ncbi:hypothetical protein [Amycolatopsis sp. H20-H5]|uniref:hypothetical protein n=1 Tax=Amycolatopsis sp. H20-H5 TaxID=3046309 RepID=UPI002DBDE345|nr:hypothetical protein [Amycolatopsis sp. H20-H5]MEC3981575.1 hypothetical protein [Amycolatopsis sp. H20-H5]
MRTRTLVIQAGLLAVAGGLVFVPVASATAPPPHLTVSPSAVAPGQALEFSASCYGRPDELTSPGLAAAVTLTGSSSSFVGHGRAGRRPGHFRASFYCKGDTGLPAASGTATVEFDVVCDAPKPPTSSQTPAPAVAPAAPASPAGTCGTPPPTKTPSPQPKPTKPGPVKPPQVKVKPQGAPQTGGGALAGLLG